MKIKANYYRTRVSAIKELAQCKKVNDSGFALAITRLVRKTNEQAEDLTQAENMIREAFTESIQGLDENEKEDIIEIKKKEADAQKELDQLMNSTEIDLGDDLMIPYNKAKKWGLVPLTMANLMDMGIVKDPETEDEED